MHFQCSFFLMNDVNKVVAGLSFEVSLSVRISLRLFNISKCTHSKRNQNSIFFFGENKYHNKLSVNKVPDFPACCLQMYFRCCNQAQERHKTQTL